MTEPCATAEPESDRLALPDEPRPRLVCAGCGLRAEIHEAGRCWLCVVTRINREEGLLP